MKSVSYNLFSPGKIISILVVCLLACFAPVRAQDILVAEYKFEANQQGWTSSTTGPTWGWVAGVNWAANGGTAGCFRHNVPFAGTNAYAFSPAIALTAGKQYYVKFGIALSGVQSSNCNRVQLRFDSTIPNLLGGTTVLASTNVITTAASTYNEYTTSNYTPATTGNFYIKIGDFYSTSCGLAFYIDGVRLYEVNTGGPTITTSAITPTTYCAGDAVSVPFTITGTFTAGNTFTAQLSDASGSFTTPTAIGTLSGTTAGTITATIPSGATAGTVYRIRVIGSTPATTGANNGTNITVNATPTACATTPSPANAASSQSQLSTLSWAAVSGATGYDVYFGTPTPSLVSSNQSATTYNPGTLGLATSYSWYVLPRNTCGTNTSCNASPWTFVTAQPLYRTVASGNWGAISTWEYSTDGGTNYSPAITTPTSANSDGILIRNGHVVTVAANVTVDQVTFDNTANSTISVNTGVTLTVNNGTGNDIDFATNSNARLIVNGTLTNQGQINGSSATIVSVTGTGTYDHAVDGGSILTATWDAASNCNITGIVSATPANLAQVFGNITWNSPGQVIGPDLTAANNPVNVQGTFLYRSSGTLDLSGINRVWTGDLYVGGVIGLLRGSTYTTSSLTIRNLTINDNYNSLTRLLLNNNSLTSSLTSSLYVTGNVLINPTANLNPAISFNTFGNALLTPIAEIEVRGNWTQTNGILTGVSSLAQNLVRFATGGVKTFIKTGGSWNNVNCSVFSPAVLDMGNYVLDNIGNFTLVSGAGLMVGSANGIASSGASGNIQNTVGTRTFTGTCDYTYYNAYGSGTQITGTGLPATINSLTTNNASGITLTAPVTISNTLTLTSGLVSIGNNSITLPATATLAGTPGVANMIVTNGTGEFIRGFNSGAGAFTFPVGDATPYYSPATINFSANSAAGTVGIRAINSTEPNNNTPSAPGVYLSRYWAFTNTLANYTYTGTFEYPSANLSNTAIESFLKLSKWTGAAWFEHTGSAAASGSLSITTPLTQATAALTGNFTGRTQACISPDLDITDPVTVCSPATADITTGVAVDNYNIPGSLSYFPTLGDANANTNPLSNPAAIAVSSTYYIKKTATTGGCTDVKPVVVEVVNCNSDWIGGTGDWSVPANWNPSGIPNNCAATVTILSGHPTISASNIQVGNISVAAGATVTLQGRDLNVCGNWDGGSGSNAVVDGTGALKMAGGSAQTISGATKFDILQINSAAGVSLAAGANVSIATGLHLQHGAFNTSAGTLRLLSASASNHAYIDDFTATFDGTISGNVTVDRYVPVTGNNQHFISSPVAAPALSQLNASGPDGSYITPTVDCDERRSAAGTAYGSVFTYVDGHSAPGSCMLGNWRITSAGNMANARGYSAYLTGNTTFSLTGAANTAANTGILEITDLYNSGYPTVLTKQNQPIEAGWNLVGNPFPSAIDLSIDRSNGTGVQNQVQVWQTSGPFAGSWQADVIDGAPGHIIIPPFQAFMVHIDSLSVGAHTYTFYQSERTRNTTQAFYRTATENSLWLEVDYNGVKDVTKVQFNPSATTGFDGAFDANKTNGSAGRPTLYTTMNTGRWYSINTLPSLTQTTVVPVGLRPEANGTMVISPQGLETFDATTYLMLEDKLTNTWHNLRNGAYSFTTTKADAQDRFVLHFSPAAQILTSDANCETPGQVDITQPGSTNWNYTLSDAANATISSGVVNQYSPVSVSVNAGSYLLTLTDNIGYTVAKSIEVSGLQQVKANFTPSTNNALIEEDITFNSTSGDAVNSNSWNFGDGTSATGQTATHNYQSEGVYNVSLTVANAEGCTSTSSRTVTVTSRSTTTGIDDLTNKGIQIWSNGNRVFVDFSKQGKVEAEIEMYNVIGQLLSSEKFGRASVYTRQVPHAEAAYVIVKVKNEGEVTTRKIFLSGGNK